MQEETQLAELCRLAEERAASLGHVLAPWSAPEDVSRRTVCSVCGRAAYVRAEGSLAGIAGRACTESCSGAELFPA
jgi:hypothetical protein